MVKLKNGRVNQARTRSISYVVLLIVLLLGGFILRKMTWKSNGEMHTLLECIATLLALIGGLMSLVRYYTKKSSTFLLLGSGFLGTAVLNDSTEPWLAEFAPAANRNVPALLIARAPGWARVCTGGGVICVSAPVVVSTVNVSIPRTSVR